MKWIAWGNRVMRLGGRMEKEACELGRFESAMNYLTAFNDAYARWGRSVDHVQSVVSYNIERRETELQKKNGQWVRQRATK